MLIFLLYFFYYDILLIEYKLVTYLSMKNVETNYIPRKDELENVAAEMYPTWHRKAVQNGTNCVWEMINYIKNDRNIKLFAKKSFLKWDINNYEEDYKYIKSKFKNIIPSQWFVSSWHDIFVFCVPISIKIDVLTQENRDYLIKTLSKKPKLFKQFKFFVRKYEELMNEWKILDLYWTENLVVSDEDKLYYIDSFLVFNDSKTVINWSIENLDYLKSLIDEIDGNM